MKLASLRIVSNDTSFSQAIAWDLQDQVSCNCCQCCPNFKVVSDLTTNY